MHLLFIGCIFYLLLFSKYNQLYRVEADSYISRPIVISGELNSENKTIHEFYRILKSYYDATGLNESFIIINSQRIWQREDSQMIISTN